MENALWKFIVASLSGSSTHTFIFQMYPSDRGAWMCAP